MTRKKLNNLLRIVLVIPVLFVLLLIGVVVDWLSDFIWAVDTKLDKTINKLENWRGPLK